MSRLDRFKRLEAPRTERAGEAPRATGERFNRMEPERSPADAPPPPPPPSAAAERVRREVGDQPLALDSPHTVEQQFIRCMHCEADNSRFAQDCVHCGAALQTEAQRDFNEQFWRKRQAQAEEEQQAVEQFHRGQQQLTRAQAEERARAYAAMVDEARSDGLTASSGVPPGIRLLRAMKDPVSQLLLIGGFAVVGVGSVALLLRPANIPAWLGVACLGALIGLAVLFTPPSWWVSSRYGRRGRGWFFGDDDW